MTWTPLYSSGSHVSRRAAELAVARAHAVLVDLPERETSESLHDDHSQTRSIHISYAVVADLAGGSTVCDLDTVAHIVPSGMARVVPLIEAPTRAIFPGRIRICVRASGVALANLKRSREKILRVGLISAAATWRSRHFTWPSSRSVSGQRTEVVLPGWIAWAPMFLALC